MAKRIITILIWLLLIVSGFVYAVPGVNDLLAEIDEMMDLESDCTAKVKITQQKAGEGVKVYEAIYYLRDRDDAFLIIMTAPEVEKGNGYLKLGDNFWMYRRNTRTFQHINRDESIAGTNAKGGDFENKKLTELYAPALDAGGKEITSQTTLGKIPVYQFELTAKTEDVTYPKVIFWVRQDNYLPLKTEGYSLSGTLMESAYYLKYTKIGGKYLWVQAMFVDEFEKGNKTVVEIQNISLQKIEDHVFTKTYLENLSK
ncbi:MAG TPA: outer membrane lipoprotein-sorting protein [Bacillota bacterium]